MFFEIIKEIALKTGGAYGASKPHYLFYNQEASWSLHNDEL
jgi:hypothetical protein